MFAAVPVVAATGGFHERKEDICSFKTNTLEDNEMEHLGERVGNRRLQVGLPRGSVIDHEHIHGFWNFRKS